MRFGKLEINPASNPAVLDTATWDSQAVRQIVEGAEVAYLATLADALRADGPLPCSDDIMPFETSRAYHQGAGYVLAGLSDHQHIFLEVRDDDTPSVLGAAIVERALPAGRRLRVYPTQADVLDRFFQHLLPARGPHAWGAIPRLGLGARMTTFFWPAAYRAMGRCGFAANTIQNSTRELNLLEDVLAGAPPEEIYYPGFGNVASGHTGSTFEGLWVYGTLEALKSDHEPRYGADADHIKIAPDEAGLAAARRWLKACRLYTFFTLDVSPLLDYTAMRASSPSDASRYLERKVPAAPAREALIRHYRRPHPLGGQHWQFDDASLGRMVGKYWDALDAMESLTEDIRALRAGRPFDLEFAIDEHPPYLAGCECITSNEEVAFVLLECQRRGIPMTHLAPNFGVEKGWDYRCPDGLEGLSRRAELQSRMAAEQGVIIDFHSGDDLSATARRVIGRATAGHNHFKVSPEPQMIFAETVRDVYPELFHRWWNDALDYARQEASAGSEFAAQCLRAFDAAGASPSVRDPIFHNFGFAYVGRRGADGQYLHREELYSLSDEFQQEYARRIEAYLCELAEDLFQCP